MIDMRLPEHAYREKCHNDQYFLGVLLDAANAAQTFLSNYLHVLSSENKRKIRKVISLYQQMNDSIFTSIPYHKTTAVFCQDPALVWNQAMRARLAEALSQNSILEQQLRVMVGEGLGDWEK